MLSSLSAGVSGLENFQQDMDVIGNDIANINTTAFKAGIVNFADSLSNTIQGGTATLPAEQIGTGVAISSIGSNWTTGGLTNTGVTSNLAISGNGFFQVQDTSGTPYVTQDGTFTLNAAGNLVTQNGDLVMGKNAAGTVAAVVIAPPSGKTLTSYNIDSAGNITMNLSDGTTASAGSVTLVSVADPSLLVSEGNNLYSNALAANDSVALAPTTAGTSGLGTLTAGAVESSNVDLSSEMANLITAQRAFEANSKTITTANEVLQTLVQLKQN